ncbi:MAG: DNA repair protein RadA [Candidatus Kapabacteria bacterium]|nr:DNA repair protein RadA [Candidatus Kapabacteria bacterium]
MKTKSVYICQSCAFQSPKWAGKCPSCGAWGTFVEEVVRDEKRKSSAGAAGTAKITTLNEVESSNGDKLITGIAELDRVLGGGITRGSLILVGGDPGIGKSTLMLQICAAISKHAPIYITGEESLQQIKMRAARLTNVPDNLMLLAETDIYEVTKAIAGSEAGVAIVDSIQTMQSAEIDSTPGSISQVRECAARLMEVAKRTHKPVFMVGHVNKEGSIAGPKVLEHTVDTVLQFEGEGVYSYRILRALKNRYGSTNEIGIFEMGETGLREVHNPSEIFLTQRSVEESGTAVCASIEGTRPLLVEVQALVTPTSYNVPQRSSTGFEYKRLQMIIAILEKRLGLNFAHNDVFVNVAGGVSLNDPAVDLGIAAALVSSLRDIPVAQGTVFIGEVGLTGEVRTVTAIEQRLGESQKLGFKRAVLPQANVKKMIRGYDIELCGVERISLALAQIFS